MSTALQFTGKPIIAFSIRKCITRYSVIWLICICLKQMGCVLELQYFHTRNAYEQFKEGRLYLEYAWIILGYLIKTSAKKFSLPNKLL